MVVAALLALSRSRVTAEPERIVVVNGFRRRVFDRHAVVAVHLGRGAPWATLDLDDGTTRPGHGHPGLRRRPRPSGPCTSSASSSMREPG